MENNVIMSMESKVNTYLKNALIALGVGAILLLFGMPTIFACLKYDYSDELSALIFGLAACFFGIDALQIAAGNYIKGKKAKNTYIIVTADEISGQINARDFAIKSENIVSTSIQVCSVACNYEGTPQNMNPSFFAKLYAQTNNYLCLFTDNGKSYYIDCLTSLETAKNTIDSVVAKNIALRKENV